MSVQGTGMSCLVSSPSNDPTHIMEVFDSLPREVRDLLNQCPANLCVECALDYFAGVYKQDYDVSGYLAVIVMLGKACKMLARDSTDPTFKEKFGQ